MVVEIISPLNLKVGDEITTETARARRPYRFIDNDNRLILYQTTLTEIYPRRHNSTKQYYYWYLHN